MHASPAVCILKRLPADGLSFDLLVEPGVQRFEVVEDGRRVHLFGAGNFLECVRPRLRESHRKHGVQLFPCLCTLINRTAIQLTSTTRSLRKSTMELELENVRKKISRVRHVSRNVILSSR